MGDKAMETPILERLQKELIDAAGHVVVLAKYSHHSYVAKSFVERVLGRPQSAKESAWTFAEGKVVHFLTEQSSSVDRYNPSPVRGFAGPVLWFGPDACDEFHGIRR